WEVMRELPGVDRERVGFYGESEGAWIAPIAAARQPEVDFVILASAPVVSPREQAAYATANYLYNTNVPRGMFRAIPRALGSKFASGWFVYVDFDVPPSSRISTSRCSWPTGPPSPPCPSSRASRSCASTCGPTATMPSPFVTSRAPTTAYM